MAAVGKTPTFRFSGECPGPRESTTVRLIRPDDLLRHLGVQDRPHVSTTAVSEALAAGISIRRPDLPPPERGVGLARSLPRRLPCSIRRWNSRISPGTRSLAVHIRSVAREAAKPRG
jgi:hypothetical protein